MAQVRLSAAGAAGQRGAPQHRSVGRLPPRTAHGRRSRQRLALEPREHGVQRVGRAAAAALPAAAVCHFPRLALRGRNSAGPPSPVAVA